MLLKILGYYIFIYPIAMSIIWVIGSLYFWIYYERKSYDVKKFIKSYPNITILVPCYNESKTIERTCKNLSCLDYPNYKVIFIDDCSKDSTVNIIKMYVYKSPIFHLIRLDENQGKAGALNIGLNFVNTQFVLILDADTIINGNTLKYLIEPFIYRSNLGAVTANPIPDNKKSFLSKIQTAEFMSIIGLIKRSQSVFGYVFTVSGCATLYKTEILQKVGGFSTVTATEDIDATWRIQRGGYRVWFQPKAIALIQVPQKVREYWKQRKRWATGGWHFLRTHKDIFLNWKLRNIWLLFFDFIFSYSWALCFVMLIAYRIVSLFRDFNINMSYMMFLNASIISIVSLVQLLFAIIINYPYDKELKRCIFWIPWYPIIFFLIGAVLVVWTAPKSLLGNRVGSGKWNSPKRI